jgi:hypothetical protein
MESFEDIQRQEEAHLLGEIGALGRRLVELGWSHDQVVAYVKQLLTESMDPASGETNSIRKED